MIPVSTRESTLAYFFVNTSPFSIILLINVHAESFKNSQAAHLHEEEGALLASCCVWSFHTKRRPKTSVVTPRMPVVCNNAKLKTFTLIFASSLSLNSMKALFCTLSS
jgi:hypothetical protein